MQLVVEISEADYEYFNGIIFVEPEDCLRQSPEDRKGTLALFRLVDGLKSGIVLPNGHGRLIDADRLLTIQMRSKYYHLNNGDTAIPIIDVEHAYTVVPADKGGE